MRLRRIERDMKFLEDDLRESSIGRAEKQEAHADLRAKGVVAIGANDGWVDRKSNTWCPPGHASIYGPIEVGSLIALGWPGDGFKIKNVTGVERSCGMTCYRFESET